MRTREQRTTSARGGRAGVAALALLVALAAAAPAARAACDPPADGGPGVELVTTEGSICIDLDPANAPETVQNFLFLVDSGLYDGTFFHRSAEYQNGMNFVIQAGGFRYLGGGAFERIEAGFSPEDPFAVSNTRGTVSMARRGEMSETASESQFFINLADANTQLDAQGFTAFGSVYGSTMAVADTIADFPVINGFAFHVSEFRSAWITLPLTVDVISEPPLTYGCFDPKDGFVLGNQLDGFIPDEHGLLNPFSGPCNTTNNMTGCTEGSVTAQQVNDLALLGTTNAATTNTVLANVTCENVAASKAGREQLAADVNDHLIVIEEALRLPEPGAAGAGAAALGALAALRRLRRRG